MTRPSKRDRLLFFVQRSEVEFVVVVVAVVALDVVIVLVLISDSQGRLLGADLTTRRDARRDWWRRATARWQWRAKRVNTDRRMFSRALSRR